MTIAFVNAEVTVLVHVFTQDDGPAIIHVATRSDPGDVWGPPVAVQWDGYGNPPGTVRLV